MGIKKIAIQALVGAVLFTIISVILEGSYGDAVWMEKGLRGLLFGVVYGLFLVIKQQFIRK